MEATLNFFACAVEHGPQSFDFLFLHQDVGVDVQQNINVFWVDLLSEKTPVRPYITIDFRTDQTSKDERQSVHDSGPGS